MSEKESENKPSLISQAPRLIIGGLLSFIELSVKLMAGTVIVTSKTIKLLMKKKEEDRSHRD